MKKFLLGILIGGIVFGTIGATAAYVYTARDIGYIPTDENWNVTNANEAISSLKTDVNSLNEYRSNIVESLVDKGVDVNENSSMADIKNGIENMNGTTFFGLGSWIYKTNNVFSNLSTNAFDGMHMLVVFALNNDYNSYIKINNQSITKTKIGYGGEIWGAGYNVYDMTKNDTLTINDSYSPVLLFSKYDYEIIHVNKSSQVVQNDHKKWICFIPMTTEYYQNLKINNNTYSGYTLISGNAPYGLSYKDVTEYVHKGDTISNDNGWGALLVGIDY